MKRKGFTFAAFLLVLAMVLPFGAQAAAPDTPDIKTGTFHFGAHDVSDHDLTDSYIYTDEFFSGTAYNYNEHLATMSMQLASASISSKSTSDYAKKSQNLDELLTNLGFTDFETNECYKTRPGEQTMGAACAHKTVTGDDGKTYTLLAVIPRSAGYEREWAGNFTVGGGDGLHAGFVSARNYVVDFAKTYVAEKNITGDNIKIWTVGYSRGAATANLTGGLMVDEPDVLGNGTSIAPQNIYDYTFGTPMGAVTSMNPRAEKYGCIHNIFADYDPIAMLAPEVWGFDRYGVDTYLPVHNSAAKTGMLSFLEKTNPTVYATYTNPAAGADPDNFKPLKFSYADGKLSIVYDADNTDPAKTSQKQFLLDRIAALAAGIPTRDDYAENYQTMLANFMSLYFGMSDSDYAKFNAAIGGNQDAAITAALLYGSYAAETMEPAELHETLKSMVQLVESDPDYAQYVAGSAEFAAFRDTINTISDEDFAAQDAALTAKLNAITDTELKSVLTAAMGSIEMDETLRTAILDDTAVDALRRFVCVMMFGGSDNTSMLGLESAPLKRAATLIGNAGSYMRVHNNEIIVSWLRTQDSWYSYPTSIPFADVSEESWYRAAVGFVYQNGLFAGTSETTFAPDQSMNRAMLVTVLWRLAGKPAAKAACVFTDVSPQADYAEAVAWANENGIVKGYDAKTFGPTDSVTREQLAVILYRYAGCRGMDVSIGETTNILSYDDAFDVCEYAIPAMQWACGAGLIEGSENKLMPHDDASRAQVAAIFTRFYDLGATTE